MKRFLAICAVCATLPMQALAVEGGVETYLLGSRGSMAGVLPPAGTYLNNDFVSFSGSAPTLPIAGAAVVDPDLSVFSYKFSLTHVFDAQIGSAHVGVNINIPYVSASMDFSGAIGTGISGRLTDDAKALADITISPMLGWKHGKLSTTAALMMFLPTGSYEVATIDVPGRSVHALNTGKNRFAIDPTVALTWFDPESGWEVSGALGVTFSQKNKDTDYQTAPEAHFEGAVMKHLPNQLAVGLTGYAYQQLRDDSGSGADNFKALTGAQSLKARVFGLGPSVSWATQIGKTPVSLRASYIKEFNARRRFESEKFWFTLGIVF
jgi:hypothetical protein